MNLRLQATKNFLCGQVVSLFSLMALVMAKRLVYRNVSTPILLNACLYVLLAAVYLLCGWLFPPTACASTKRNSTVKWWLYPILAAIDVQANICATTSLLYISFSTAGLTLNLAVPFVFTLTVFAFRASFKCKHCIGCLITLVGAIVLVMGCYARQDAHALGSEDEVYGWSLAVVAAMLYAGSTVINQWCVQIRGLDATIDSLGKLGAWGAVYSMVQVLLFERDEIAAARWDTQSLLLVLGYVLCMFAFYTAVFVLVKATESTIYNLSLLFSSVYLMAMARQALDETLDVYTWSAMVIMLVGLGIYTWTRNPIDGDSEADAGVPQIGFRSMHTPTELIPNKLQLAEV